MAAAGTTTRGTAACLTATTTRRTTTTTTSASASPSSLYFTDLLSYPDLSQPEFEHCKPASQPRGARASGRRVGLLLGAAASRRRVNRLAYQMVKRLVEMHGGEPPPLLCVCHGPYYRLQSKASEASASCRRGEKQFMVSAGVSCRLMGVLCEFTGVLCEKTGSWSQFGLGFADDCDRIRNFTVRKKRY